MNSFCWYRECAGSFSLGLTLLYCFVVNDVEENEAAIMMENRNYS